MSISWYGVAILGILAASAIAAFALGQPDIGQLFVAAAIGTIAPSPAKVGAK